MEARRVLKGSRLAAVARQYQQAKGARQFEGIAISMESGMKIQGCFKLSQSLIRGCRRLDRPCRAPGGEAFENRFEMNKTGNADSLHVEHSLSAHLCLRLQHCLSLSIRSG